MNFLQNNWHRFRFVWLGIIIIFITAGLLLISFLTKPYTYHGTVINPPKAAPDFSLQDTQGNTFRLSDYKGQLVLIFFGYTNCPDECPATCAILEQVWSGLGTKTSQVKFVFITVDPDRDTAPVLRTFLAKFNSQFIGLTGSVSELQPVWTDFGVYVTKSGSGADYSVSHSLNLYLVDKQGDVYLIYPYPTTTDELLKDLSHLLG